MKGRQAEFEKTTAGIGINILACVSFRGIEAIQLLEKRVSILVFQNFLKTLLESISKEDGFDDMKVSVVLDNLNVHSDKEVLQIFQKYKSKVIFTAHHSPVLNMIEHFFLLVKQKLRSELKISKKQCIKHIETFVRNEALCISRKLLSIFYHDQIRLTI